MYSTTSIAEWPANFSVSWSSWWGLFVAYLCLFSETYADEVDRSLTSTANDSAAAMAMAGAPRTTMSLIAFLNSVNELNAQCGHKHKYTFAMWAYNKLVII